MNHFSRRARNFSRDLVAQGRGGGILLTFVGDEDAPNEPDGARNAC